MSFIELAGIDEVSEKKVLPEGRYDLVVMDNPKPKRNEQSGKVNLLVVIAIEGRPDAQNILHNISLPAADDENEARNFKLLQIKRFCHAFNIQLQGNSLNTEGFAGSRASGIPVAQDEYQGTVKNVLKLPPLPIEG